MSQTLLRFVKISLSLYTSGSQLWPSRSTNPQRFTPALIKLTWLEFLVTPKTLIDLFKCVLLELELIFAGKWKELRTFALYLMSI